MRIVIDIPEEQIKKSLKESEYVLEDEGIKGYVNIVMLYTNGRLEFLDIERREDFYSCDFTLLQKGHGRLIDADQTLATAWTNFYAHEDEWQKKDPDYVPLGRFYDQNGFECCQQTIVNAPTIIEADTTS